MFDYAGSKGRQTDLASLIADAATGLAAMLASVALAVVLGGFSDFAPWLFATMLLSFTAGVLRGRAPGSAWAVAARINVGAWCLFVLWLRSEWRTLLLALLTTAFSALCGVAVRRRRTRHRGDEKPRDTQNVA